MTLPEMVGSWSCGFPWEGVMGTTSFPVPPLHAQPTGLADGPASGSHPTLRTGLFALPQDSRKKERRNVKARFGTKRKTPWTSADPRLPHRCC